MLDAGVFIEAERDRTFLKGLITKLGQAASPQRTTQAVIAQVWRGKGNPDIARLLNLLDIDDIGDGRPVGRLLGAAGKSDVVDASLVIAAKQTGSTVITYDPDDIGPLAEIVGVTYTIAT